MPGTERCIGTYTAVNTAMEAIDRVRDTASSHHRAIIVEVMGRNSGYIAVQAGIATGAEMIITPERPMELSQVFHEMEEVQLGPQDRSEDLPQLEPGRLVAVP